jgi:hypothetical protein
LHDGSPMVGVSGVGLTLRDAFQGCIGEGIEYLSQLQAGTDLLLKPGVDDWAGKLGPKRWSWSLPFRNAVCNRSERFPGVAQRG